MKAIKFFAMALVALTFMGCPKEQPGNGDTPDNPQQETTLALDQTSITINVEETATINATVDATWVSSNPAVATVAGAGKVAIVTAVAEGNSVITATTAGGQTKTCVVLVKKASNGTDGGAAVKGSQVWPIIMDGATYAANESKIVASFQPNDVDQFLYVWENTYAGGNATGLNFAGNSEGYTALTVTTGWAGAGFCLTETGTGWQAAEALRAAIVANPDEYFLHMAIKSTDNYSHCFYAFGNEATKFVLGPTAVYDGAIYANFTRDGSWQEFDIPMSTYAAALATAPCVAGVNVFVALTEGVVGAQLNLDAVYFYKK
jgi:hypothetical protein